MVVQLHHCAQLRKHRGVSAFLRKGSVLRRMRLLVSPFGAKKILRSQCTCRLSCCVVLCFGVCVVICLPACNVLRVNTVDVVSVGQSELPAPASLLPVWRAGPHSPTLQSTASYAPSFCAICAIRCVCVCPALGSMTVRQNHPCINTLCLPLSKHMLSYPQNSDLE